MKNDKDLVSQWEKMGTSTGGMIGRFIGLAAETGLRAIDELVLTPLAKTRDQVNKSSGTGNSEQTRSEVWSSMGRQYGEKMGSAVGIAMDTTIEATDNTMVRPMESVSNHQNTDNNENPPPENNENA